VDKDYLIQYDMCLPCIYGCGYCILRKSWSVHNSFKHCSLDWCNDWCCSFYL